MLKGRVEIPWKLFSLWERLAALHPLPARHFPASSAQTAGKAEWECVENVENSRPTTKDFPLGLRDESIVRRCARWSRVGKFSREKILHILLSTRSISGMFRRFSVFCAVWQRKCAEENFRAIKKHQENLKKENHLPKGKLVTNLLTLLSYQNNCRGRSRTDWVIDKPSVTASEEARWKVANNPRKSRIIFRDDKAQKTNKSKSDLTAANENSTNLAVSIKLWMFQPWKRGLIDCRWLGN